MKIMVDDEYVASSLKQLLEWADYIVESLTVDHGFEAGKVASLKRMVGESSLKDLRQTAWALREKLNIAVVRSEVGCSPPKSLENIAKVG
jgi:hypothetical protein